MGEQWLAVDALFDAAEHPAGIGRGLARAVRRRVLTEVLVQVAMREDLDRQTAERLVSGQVALGRKPPEDGMVERFPISSTSLMSRLGTVTSKGLDRKTARAFLGLPRDATQTSILDAYKLRSRVLVRRLARAKADDELALVHRSRNALRGVRDLAIV